MKPRVYLDTSVISALHDARTPQRQALTADFWRRLSTFEAATSDLAREEIAGTTNAAQRQKLLESLATIAVFPITPEMRDLAGRYLTAGIFTRTQSADALHVAAAVVGRFDILVSWNFKHLVNRRRRAAIDSVNLAIGAGKIDIIAPPEL